MLLPARAHPHLLVIEQPVAVRIADIRLVDRMDDFDQLRHQLLILLPCMLHEWLVRDSFRDGIVPILKASDMEHAWDRHAWSQPPPDPCLLLIGGPHLLRYQAQNKRLPLRAKPYSPCHLPTCHNRYITHCPRKMPSQKLQNLLFAHNRLNGRHTHAPFKKCPKNHTKRDFSSNCSID